MKDQSVPGIHSTRYQVLLKCLVPVCLWVSTTSLWAQEKTIREINVFPPAVQLDSARDFQTIIVQAIREDSVTEDVTGSAKMAF